MSLVKLDKIEFPGKHQFNDRRCLMKVDARKIGMVAGFEKEKIKQTQLIKSFKKKYKKIKNDTDEGLF